MKILFLTNVPSPYRVDFFNELGKHCDLTVLFEKKTSDERNSSWKDYSFENFKGIFLKGKSIATDSAVCFGVRKYVTDKSFDRIICSNFSAPTGIIAVSVMKHKKIPYFLEADGGSAKDGRGFKEKIKKHIISGAAGYFSTAKSCDEYFIAYGAEKDKIYRYPFTSVFDREVLQNPVSKEEKIKLRSELGLCEDKIIVSVGRFSYLNGYGKGYDTLVNICEKLPDNVGVYIIGDEPTEEFVRLKAEKQLSNLHFLPFKLKNELFKYYRAADLSVLLTRGEAWGLVVNEAMANALPVVTTDVCVGGIELIQNGVNGYIVPVNAVDFTAKIIEDYLSSDSLQYEMGQKALEKIRDYTFEKMVYEHLNILSY